MSNAKVFVEHAETLIQECKGKGVYEVDITLRTAAIYADLAQAMAMHALAKHLGSIIAKNAINHRDVRLCGIPPK